MTGEGTSEARYRAIVEDQPEMVCRFRPDGTLTFANRAYGRYFGRSPAELVGRRYAPVVHPEDQAAVEAALATLTPARPVVSIENRVFRADGAVCWTQWTNHAIYDGRGRLVEIQATGRDITQQKAAEADDVRLAAAVVRHVAFGLARVRGDEAAERLWRPSGGRAPRPRRPVGPRKSSWPCWPTNRATRSA